MIAKAKSLLTGDGLKARAIRGTLLSVVGFGGGQFIRLASNLILTRLLFPEAFGLMVLVYVVIAALEMFSDFALNHSIIRSDRGDEPSFLRMAWTLQIIRGAVLWIMACALALPAAEFYEQDALRSLIPVVAFSTVINGFVSISLITANRHLQLGILTLLDLTSQIVAAVSMILIALWTGSTWALAVGPIVGALARTVLSHICLASPNNRIGWNQSAFLEIFHFGKYILVGTISGFFIQNGDRLILGKFVSLEDLAVFGIALTLASLPQMLGSHVINRVILPLYRMHPPAESEHNRQQIYRAFLPMRGGLLLCMGLLAIVGVVLIGILYDPRYQDAGPLLVILALTASIKVVTIGYDAALMAAGNSRNFTILATGGAIVRTAFLFLLVPQFGLAGAAMAPLFADLLIYPALIYFIHPYRAWYPKLDLVLFLVAGLLAASALGLNPSVMTFLSDTFS